MYCTACGEELPDDARYCHNCGTAVNAGVAAAPAPYGGPPRAVPGEPLVAPPSEGRSTTGHESGQPATTSTPLVHPAPGPAAGTPLSGVQVERRSSAYVGSGGFGGGGGAGASNPTGSAPGGKKRGGLFIAIVAVAVIVIAAAIAVPLVLAGESDEEAAASSTSSTGSSIAESTSTAVPTVSNTSVSTTSTISGGPVGDSPGEWVERTIEGAPDEVVTVAISDDVLLMQTRTDNGYALYAYSFLSDSITGLPVEATDVGSIDIYDNVAVWWEGTYDEASGFYVDQHICSFSIPDGPRVEVAGEGRNVGYPQVAGMWITWTEGAPWEVNPEEYWRMPIYGSLLPGEDTASEPVELVSSALAFVMGDSSWTYSLGETFLAWEQAAAVGGLDTGTYVVDLTNPGVEPRSIGLDAWRPSISLNRLVYWQNGLRVVDLESGETRDVDPNGDFATAAPTYAVYYRPVQTDDSAVYEIVARGFSGTYEQALVQQADAPWLSPVIAASSSRVAFVADGVLHVFEWKSR